MANTTIQKKFWNRVGRVEIQDNAGNMVSFGGVKDGEEANNGLDFRFNGVKTGDIYGEFSVGILGLSTETIQQLTTWNIANAVKIRRRIKVFAGYYGDALANPIFDGYILEAMPTNPPEMWLNFRCMRYYETNQPIVGVGPEHKATLATIANRIAYYVNLKWNKDNWLSTRVHPDSTGDFQFNKTKTQLMADFASKFHVQVYEKNGMMYVGDTKPWFGDLKAVKSLSINNGLLAVGNINMAGATVSRRLCDDIGLCEWIYLKSTLIPSANGYYMVIRKTHKGHFRGDEWVTELQCIRRNAQV